MENVSHCLEFVFECLLGHWNVANSSSAGAQFDDTILERQLMHRSKNHLRQWQYWIVGPVVYFEQVSVSEMMKLIVHIGLGPFLLYIVGSHILFHFFRLFASLRIHPRSTTDSELFDTFFIVIHKKPLIFLHWYHHITVLLYCWHSYVTTSPPGIFFVVMNYSVHASMYFYYALMAMRIRPKWFNPMLITAFQISQMIVGIAVTLVAFYYYMNDPDGNCKIERENNTAAFVMYGSYLFLFGQFFVGRYFASAKKFKNKLA